MAQELIKKVTIKALKITYNSWLRHHMPLFSYHCHNLHVSATFVLYSKMTSPKLQLKLYKIIYI